MRFYVFLWMVFMCFCGEALHAQVNWSVQELVEGGRIDAIADLGDGVVIAGSRWPHPGMIFRSTDYGRTWEKVKSLVGTQEPARNFGILGLAGDKKNRAYLITANGQFWKSEDKGLTWEWTGGLDTKPGIQAFSYSICVTPQETVLVTRGFFVYRSTDFGSHFEKRGPVSDNYLYRLQRADRKIFANGWDGKLFVSEDDGRTWSNFAQLGPPTYPKMVYKPYNPIKSQPHLTAIEYLEDGRIIQGTMTGENYVIDESHPDQIERISTVEGSLDDYVYLGNGVIIGSTFLDDMNNFISYDGAETWVNIGPIPTGAGSDWLDHVISLDEGDSVIAIGGTRKGFIVRAEFSKKELKKDHVIRD